MLTPKKSREYIRRASQRLAEKPKRRGPPVGHPGWGGRPPQEIPCPWGCGRIMGAAELRKHLPRCPKRPK